MLFMVSWISTGTSTVKLARVSYQHVTEFTERLLPISNISSLLAETFLYDYELRLTGTS